MRGTSFALRRQRLKSRTGKFCYRRKTGAAFRENRCADRILYRCRPKSKKNRTNFSIKYITNYFRSAETGSTKNSDFFFDVPDAKVRPARSSQGRSTSRYTERSLFWGRKPPRVIYLFFRKQTRKVRFGTKLQRGECTIKYSVKIDNKNINIICAD